MLQKMRATTKTLKAYGFNQRLKYPSPTLIFPTLHSPDVLLVGLCYWRFGQSFGYFLALERAGQA